MLSLDGDDPVAIQLRASRRRLAGVAVFSGVVNLLYKNLAEQGKRTPLLALRLNKLRQLAQAQPA